MNECANCPHYQALMLLTRQLIAAACKSSSDLKPFELGNIIEQINDLGVKKA